MVVTEAKSQRSNGTRPFLIFAQFMVNPGSMRFPAIPSKLDLNRDGAMIMLL
jgi:hypothetical protein